jgi:hypothetical protein
MVGVVAARTDDQVVGFYRKNGQVAKDWCAAGGGG